MERGPRQHDLMAEHLASAREAGTLFVAIGLAAELLKHPFRGRIVEKPPRREPLGAKLLEGETNEPPGRFGRIAKSPEGLADPVAEFPAPGRVHAAGPNVAAIRFPQDRERQILARRPPLCDDGDEGAAVI